MSGSEHFWVLLGHKAGERGLIVFGVGFSENKPELATEHEPNALAVLKRWAVEGSANIEGYRFHASRMTFNDEWSEQTQKLDAGRSLKEFRRFLVRCEFTALEQKEIIENFVEKMRTKFAESRQAETEMMPLSLSLWGKSSKGK